MSSGKLCIGCPSSAKARPSSLMTSITVYTDYKSPYAYIAKDLIYAMADETGTALDWLPYTLDIPSYRGSAEVDDQGRIISENRTPHQWRQVRYAYMDCRREANKRGLTLRGTQKIWDSSIAAIGLLWAKRQADAVLRRYTDHTFKRFWRRELNIEDPAVVEGVLAAAGADVAGFAEFLAGPGRAEHDAIRAAAEAFGIFGVPSFVVDGELFWGKEHLPAIREMVLQANR
jgi:2-hydroxychromene-2-carboxylate isomerase